MNQRMYITRLLEKGNRLLSRTVWIGGIGLFLYFLYWHYRLGITRYFDVDEFAYLYWARLVAEGFIPYRDFFSYIPPGFFWILAPLFRIGLTGIDPLIAARGVMFAIFALLCFLVGFLYYRVRKTWFFIIPPLMVSFIPLPFDKFLEIRPETLSIVFLLSGILFQITAIDTEKKKYAFLSGIMYAIGVFITPKIVPNVMVSGFVLILFSLVQRRSAIPLFHKSSILAYINNNSLVIRWIVGFLLPCILFMFWLIATGNIYSGIYSLVTLPFEVNNIGRWFIMQPDLFFYPNAIFYGREGYNLGLLSNHIVWIIGLGFGLYRLFTPFLVQKQQSTQTELLISGNLFIQVFLYVSFIPLKHTQYLIPIIVFVAFYVADALDAWWRAWQRIPVLSTFYLLAVFFGGIVLAKAFIGVNYPKISMNNEKVFTELKLIFRTIPQNTYVLDLDGRTLYYRSPYYVCCLPFGQHEPFLSRPLPLLVDALERTKTPYVYEGELKRIQTLSVLNQTYIYSHYTPSGIANLWVRK